WNLKLPPKILHFLWRLLRDVLPTRGHLWRRGLEISGVCGLCGQGYEEAWHMFIDYPEAEHGWRAHGFHDRFLAVDPSAIELKDWIWTCIATQFMNMCVKLLAGFWSIWRERNNRVWNDRRTPVKHVLTECWEYISDWKQASTATPSTTQTRQGLLTPKEGEAWGLLEATRWVQELRLPRVIF
ncbi:hypothetical protein LINGRAHAP2_LOCUS4363, partial [Linum grandiflorum]